MKEKIIGVLGGMGPEATANFYFKLVHQTPALKDQEHPRVMIDSNSKIPDRTQAILYGGESPVPALIATAQNLVQAGAGIICIPCITAHYFIDALASHVTVPLVNALECVSHHLKADHPAVKTIGILSTTGTRKSGLFDNALARYKILYPTDAIQEELVMEAIYGEKGIKSGDPSEGSVEKLVTAANILIERGAEIIVMGCTEIPLVLKEDHLKVPLIDPMDLVIKHVLKWSHEK